MANDDVLTEGEIDALMESVDDGTPAAGTADDGQYRRFDFAAREQAMLREFTALQPLLERQAELLAKALESAFSIDFTVRCEQPELLSVSDAIASLEENVAVSSTTLAPLAGPAFAVSPAALLSFVVNAYFGGGVEVPADVPRSSLTPTELRLAERIAELQLTSLRETWQDKLPLEADELTTLGVADRIEQLPRNEILLRLQFSLSVAELSTSVQALLPFAALEPYRERFTPPRKKGDAPAGQSWEPFFRRELPGIELEVAGVLATRPIALADLLQLQVGAVIPLAHTDQVSLKSEEVTLAEGRYGSFEGTKAVQVQRLASLLPGLGK